MDLIFDKVSYFDQKFNMYNLMELDESTCKYVPVCIFCMHVILNWCVKTSDEAIDKKSLTSNKRSDFCQVFYLSFDEIFSLCLLLPSIHIERFPAIIKNKLKKS